MSIYLNTGIFLLPVQQAVVKRTWLAPLVWKPVNSISTPRCPLPDPPIDLEISRTEGNYRKVMAKYANPLVLVLDEWLLLKPTESEQKDIFELLHRRRKKTTTIFCSQYEFEERQSTSWVAMPALWQMLSFTVLLMIVIVSTSQALILNMTDRCVRYMV